MPRPPAPPEPWTPPNAPVYIPSMKNPLPSTPGTPRGAAGGDFVRVPRDADGTGEHPPPAAGEFVRTPRNAAGTRSHPPPTAGNTLRDPAGEDFVRTQRDAAGTRRHPPSAALGAARDHAGGALFRVPRKAAGTGGHPPSTEPGTLRDLAGEDFVRMLHNSAGTGAQHPPIAAPAASHGAAGGASVRTPQRWSSTPETAEAERPPPARELRRGLSAPRAATPRGVASGPETRHGGFPRGSTAIRATSGAAAPCR